MYLLPIPQEWGGGCERSEQTEGQTGRGQKQG